MGTDLCADAAEEEDPATVCRRTWPLRLRGAVEVAQHALDAIVV